MAAAASGRRHGGPAPSFARDRARHPPLPRAGEAGAVIRERACAALIDAVVAPAPPLPAVADTDAVDALMRYVRGSPAAGRLLLSALLAVLELAPLAVRGRPLSRLPRSERMRLVARLWPPGLEALPQLCYYGDERVLRQLGYDAEARVARGGVLRAREGRW